METTFGVLIAPLQEFFKTHSATIDKESGSRTLKFAQFTLTMIYSYIKQLGSLRKITNHLDISEAAKSLGVKSLPWTTLRDGFTRFKCDYFMRLYRSIVAQTSTFKIKSLDEIGLISLVDGSLFPTIISMEWAEYKTTKNAIRLHLELSLNQMIPLEFNGLSGNSSERNFLKKILRAGVTYIADRGYFSFKIADIIATGGAYFIIRLRNNLKIGQSTVLNVTGNIPKCLNQVTDELIRFANDPYQRVYRRVSFTILDSEFQICTNRFYLTTLQIIMLYAYRWQIELLFKFIKRVLNGIHLFNHSKNGVNIQFCLLMILSVIYLNMKQFCKISFENVKKQESSILAQSSTLEHFNTFSCSDPQEWVNSANKLFKGFWKISSYWVENLKELIHKPFDYQIISVLAAD